MSNVHWLDRPGAVKNLRGHRNLPRIDAETIARLIALKNKLLGTNTSVLEESWRAEQLQEPAL